jgi:hypothetical protein
MEIPKPLELEHQVFSVKNAQDFDQIALSVFNFQYLNNPVYQSFCDLLHRRPAQVKELADIPFLPIGFFKTAEVKSTEFEPQLVFESSRTTGMTASRHLVKKASLYEKSFLTCFNRFFGPPADYCIVGLLPSYLEQGNSSLVYMVDTLVKGSRHHSSGFYISDYARLHDTLTELEEKQHPAILFGVTYALLDFAEAYPRGLKYTRIIETGGMKGRKQEITRAELYQALRNAFQLEVIHSEYGMTELLSQAYAVNGVYSCPPWMKILVRDETDPFSYSRSAGGINVIDLANIYSCSFIATEDIGRLHEEGRFEVLGRMDNTDIRGCSLLVS